MHPFTPLRINRPPIIDEVIDGEVIMINLDTGAYYSLRAVGAAIWELLGCGATPRQIVERLAQLYAGPEALIAAGVEALLAELEQERIISPAGAGAAADLPDLPSAGGEKPPFARPALEKYTDMADLLLLDTFPEAGQPGWPAPNET